MFDELITVFIEDYLNCLETIEDYCNKTNEKKNEDANDLLSLHTKCDYIFDDFVHHYCDIMTPKDIADTLKTEVNKMHFVYVRTDNIFERQLKKWEELEKKYAKS